MSVVTRSMSTNDEILSYMDKKFEDIKVYINGPHLTEIKDIINKEVMKILDIQNERVTKCESTIAVLQEHVKNLKLQNEILSSKCDKAAADCEDVEQYGRRLCLRINGIPPKEGAEKSEEVLDKVKAEIASAGIAIPDNMIDRAHRIGGKFTDRVTKKPAQSVLVRFTTFRHRTEVYYARKSMNVRVGLDLTKHRYLLFKDAFNLVKDLPVVKFIYADVNCRLKVRFTDESRDDEFFSSIDQLHGIIN